MGVFFWDKIYALSSQMPFKIHPQSTLQVVLWGHWHADQPDSKSLFDEIVCDSYRPWRRTLILSVLDRVFVLPFLRHSALWGGSRLIRTNNTMRKSFNSGEFQSRVQNNTAGIEMWFWKYLGKRDPSVCPIAYTLWGIVLMQLVQHAISMLICLHLCLKYITTHWT